MEIKFKIGNNIFVLNKMYFGEDEYYVEIILDKYNFVKNMSSLFSILGSDDSFNALKISFEKTPTYEDIYKTLLKNKDRLDKYAKDGVLDGK